jgi:hypothetical protein
MDPMSSGRYCIRDARAQGYRSADPGDRKNLEFNHTHFEFRPIKPMKRRAIGARNVRQVNPQLFC